MFRVSHLVFLHGIVVCYVIVSCSSESESVFDFDKLSKGVLTDERPCFASVSDVRMIRKSEKQGFHRNIITNVSAVFNPACSECKFLLLEYLSEGLYVDTYQLKTLQEFGAPAVLAFEEIDVEKPEHLSRNHTIAVYSPDVQPSSSGRLTSSLDLPIHLRYHMPSSDPEVQHAEVYLPPPDLFIHCSGCPSDACTGENSGLIRAPSTAANHSIYLWTPLAYTMDNYDMLDFHVPVGQEPQSVAVTVATLLAIMTGTIALLVVMISSDDTQLKKLR